MTQWPEFRAFCERLGLDLDTGNYSRITVDWSKEFVKIEKHAFVVEEEPEMVKGDLVEQFRELLGDNFIELGEGETID